MSDFPTNEPDVDADQLLVSRALDGDATPEEMARLEADPDLVDLLARWTGIRAQLAATVDDPQVRATTSTAVASAMEAADLAEVVPFTRRRVPTWIGAAAAGFIVVIGAVAITRGGESDPTLMVAEAPATSPVATKGNEQRMVSSTEGTGETAGDTTGEGAGEDAAETASDAPTNDDSSPATTRDVGNETPGAAAEPVGTTVDTVGPPAESEAMMMTVVTVDLANTDPETEPFPMPADDEMVQLRSTDELRWLGRWATPLADVVSVCRPGDALVLLAQALISADGGSPVEVELVTDDDAGRLLALALPGCNEIMSVALD